MDYRVDEGCGFVTGDSEGCCSAALVGPARQAGRKSGFPLLGCDAREHREIGELLHDLELRLMPRLVVRMVRVRSQIGHRGLRKRVPTRALLGNSANPGTSPGREVAQTRPPVVEVPIAVDAGKSL